MTTHHYPLWMQVAPGAAGDVLPAAAVEQLRDDLAAHLGAAVTFTEPPRRLDTSFGPFAVGCRLAASRALPDEWDASLVLRAEGAAAEATVLDAAAHLPCRVPALVAPAVPVSDDLGGSVLVATWPDGTDFVEIIGRDPDRARDLFQRLARTQAALHDTGSAQVGPGVPVFDLAAELDALGPAFEAEAGWLRANAPTPAGEPVLCHGGLTPLVASLEADDDATPFTVRNWSAAVLAEPELDLGWSLLSFWIAPFFANTRSERRGMIMIRDGLANLFRTGYEAARPVDAERVRYWQAFHAARGAARALADPGSMPDEVGPNLRKRFAKLTRR
jgi:aminoglycoside phosphotransferase (APT) family kinase protein